MTNPSPLPQVEAESVDTPEFRDLLFEVQDPYGRYNMYPTMRGKARAALIAHIDSIIAARVAEAIAASQAAPAKAEGWISVDERLPADNQTVAILYWPYDNHENSQAVGAAEHIEGVFYTHEGDDHHPPSHWCAIPAIPVAPSTPSGEQQ